MAYCYFSAPRTDTVSEICSCHSSNTKQIYIYFFRRERWCGGYRTHLTPKWKFINYVLPPQQSHTQQHASFILLRFIFIFIFGTRKKHLHKFLNVPKRSHLYCCVCVRIHSLNVCACAVRNDQSVYHWMKKHCSRVCELFLRCDRLVRYQSSHCASKSQGI